MKKGGFYPGVGLGRVFGGMFGDVSHPAAGAERRRRRRRQRRAHRLGGGVTTAGAAIGGGAGLLGGYLWLSVRNPGAGPDSG